MKKRKTLRIEAEVDPAWEPYECDNCPFSYMGNLGYDELTDYCVLDNKHRCPAEVVGEKDE